MKMKMGFCKKAVLSGWMAGAAVACAAETDLARHVDPFVGTASKVRTSCFELSDE